MHLAHHKKLFEMSSHVFVGVGDERLVLEPQLSLQTSSAIQHPHRVKTLQSTTQSYIMMNDEMKRLGRRILNHYGSSSEHYSGIPTTHNMRVVFWVVNALWIIFMVVAILVCCVRSRQRLRQEQDKKETPEQRRKKLLQSFHRNKVHSTVQDDDFVEESMAESVDNACVGKAHDDALNSMEMGNEPAQEDERTVTVTMDPVELHVETGEPGYIKLRTVSGKRTVPNCCAVCLCTYEAGESIVWSSTKECLHAFHEECVVDWLMKKQDGRPCPCCRREFIDLSFCKKSEK